MAESTKVNPQFAASVASTKVILEDSKRVINKLTYNELISILSDGKDDPNFRALNIDEARIAVLSKIDELKLELTNMETGKTLVKESLQNEAFLKKHISGKYKIFGKIVRFLHSSPNKRSKELSVIVERMNRLYPHALQARKAGIASMASIAAISFSAASEASEVENTVRYTPRVSITDKTTAAPLKHKDWVNTTSVKATK